VARCRCSRLAVRHADSSKSLKRLQESQMRLTFRIKIKGLEFGQIGKDRQRIIVAERSARTLFRRRRSKRLSYSGSGPNF
jgi:hypothetical protein